jgi:hypothetical protein
VGQSALRSALVSAAFTAWSVAAVVLAFAATDNALGSWPIFSAWIGVHWFPIAAGLLLNPGPIYRARQAILSGNANIPSVNPLSVSPPTNVVQLPSQLPVKPPSPPGE